MDVVLIPGDGIGKEITESVKKVAQALNADICFKEYEAGADCYKMHGTLLEEGLLAKIEETKLALKGPTATPIGAGFRSVNVFLRQHFDTYANVRPLKTIKGVDCHYENVDLIIIRENSEDLYKGIEYMYDEDTAHGIKVISRKGCERIIHYAFEYASSHNRKKVTCVHKANIMKLTDGLFLNVFREIAKEYPQIQSDEKIIDALCMNLVNDPSAYDVLVTENLYGDILSDLCAGLIGGLGFAPSVNVGKDVRIYEAVHGSAPDIAGKDKANPTAILMAFVMLLEEQGMEKEARLLNRCLLEIIEEGKTVTEDIGGNASTTKFTKNLCERIRYVKD